MAPGLPDAPIGVVGAGTMGAGIAQVAAVGGLDVKLFDVAEGAADAARGRIASFLERSVARGKTTDAQAGAAISRIDAVSSVQELGDCFLIIEAVAEKLEVKQDLFSKLAAVTAPGTVFATNTSSLPVTAIAAGVPQSERVVGMHFFNPVPLMRLVEVIAGMNSSAEALTIARAVGAAMGRESIDASDGPGFLVNRVSRPFLLEAQQLLGEGVADAPTIDRVMRLGGGFRMGPFELSDLVGVDVGYDIAKSFYDLGHGEPRWRPSGIPAQMIAAGRLGRKSGRGYYEYPEGGAYRPEDPSPQMIESASGAVDVIGETQLARELRRLAEAAGYEVAAPAEIPRTITIDARLVTAGRDIDLSRGPVAVLCAGNSLAAAARGRDFAGFHCLPPLGEARAVEITRGSGTSEETLTVTRHFFHVIGKHVIEVGDGPGLVLGRVVCQLINEASFALQEGVGSAEDIDKGVQLGLNYPRGLMAWRDAIGSAQIVSSLDALQREIGGDRYRAAPALRRAVLEGRN
ncbi:MAG: 3-hydroxyacyl-CoA dehydrogenase [Solirubrobacterales bacterium]|nr:3-hydroxyacyl-CoA dehydrogenase [Solirubrobacterales bacterium]